jgi:hypothetical protein
MQIGYSVGWLLVVSWSAAMDLTPAEMLNNFCPCLARLACNAVLGEDGQSGLQGLLEVRPEATSFEYKELVFRKSYFKFHLLCKIIQ